MLVTKPYVRENAVAYARKFAFSQNSQFANFAGIGGNCTNFVSQCVYAGSCKMNYTKTFGWYYISLDERSPSWSGVEYFYNFITEQPEFAAENMGIGPFGREVRAREIQEGDFIQLADSTGDFYHTLIITGFEPNDILICAHSDDALDRRLSTYNFASLRLIHVDGVRIEVADDTCFENLIDGVSIDVNPPPETM